MQTSAPIITALVLIGSLTYGDSDLRSQGTSAQPAPTNSLQTHAAVSLEQLDGSHRWPATLTTTLDRSENNETTQTPCSCSQDHESMFDLLSDPVRLPAMVFPDEGIFLD